MSENNMTPNMAEKKNTCPHIWQGKKTCPHIWQEKKNINHQCPKLMGAESPLVAKQAKIFLYPKIR
jgi:hypothetical protein